MGFFCSPSECVKKQYGETWCQKHLADQQLFQLLEKVDSDLAKEARLQGCLFCGGKLHRADYDRKPRGGPQWDWRHSFCCAKEDCRRRRTPPSVRFLGRKVYAALVVVLLSTLLHGLNAERVRRIRELLNTNDRIEAARWNVGANGGWTPLSVARSGRRPARGSCPWSAQRRCPTPCAPVSISTRVIACWRY